MFRQSITKRGTDTNNIATNQIQLTCNQIDEFECKTYKSQAKMEYRRTFVSLSTN